MEDYDVKDEPESIDLDELTLDYVKKQVPEEAKPFKLVFEGPDLIIY